MTVVTRLCLSLCLLLGGCASVPENLVAPSTLPTLAEGKPKPGVHVSVSHYYGSPLPHLLAASMKDTEYGNDAKVMRNLGAQSPLAPAERQRNTTQIVRQVLSETALFEHVAMNDEPLRPGDYQLHLRLYTYWPLDGGGALGSLGTLLTFGLFPSSRPEEFKLLMALQGPDQKPLGGLANSDAIDQRVGLVNLARLGDTQEKAEYDTLKRQVDALLLRVVKGGLIPELVQVPAGGRG